MTDQTSTRRGSLLTRAPFAIFVSLVLTVLGGLPAKAVSNFCPVGTCDISDPVYVNVYWDSSEAQWDIDIASNDPSATVRRIDALTGAICHSNYFAQLHQYDIHSCTVHPSIVETGCGPPPPDLYHAHAMIGSFASCVMSIHPDLDADRTILNVFLPPQIIPPNDSEFCAKSKPNGQHDKYGSPVAVTFIPTNSACNDPGMTGIQSISAVLTHEMVEATTDPIPASITGWKVAFGNEIGDECEKLNPFAFSFLYGMVALYSANNLYSPNNPKGCTTAGVGNPPAPVPPPTPQSAAITACGAGKHMRITLSGSSIEPAPWDIAGMNGGSRTLYLSGAIASKFTVGGFWNFPADTVGFGPISWTSNAPFLGPTCAGKCNLTEKTCMNGAHSFNDRQQCIHEKLTCTAACGPPPKPVTNQIIIHGFDDNYGANQVVVTPGDMITITVIGSAFGDPTTGSIAVPGPAKVEKLSVNGGSPSWIFIGDHTAVSGKIVDVGDCPTGGIGVQLSASDIAPNVISPASTTANDDGSFNAEYTPTGAAGTHTVKVAAASATKSIAVPVHPIAVSLSKSLGVVGGGQALTLTGDGFDAAAGATQIFFEGPKAPALATMVGVPDVQTVSFLTPPSPLGKQGWVQVVAWVNGQPSQPLPFLYFVPYEPILSFSHPCLLVKKLKVDAYDANGNPAVEQITLTAAYPAFSSGGQQLSTVIVSPGDSVVLNGTGPFTATPSADPKLAVSKPFPADDPGAPCDRGANYTDEIISYVPGPDPVESIVTRPLVDRGLQSVVWSNATASETATGFVTLVRSDRTAASAAKSVEVRTLGSGDLASMTGEHPSAFVRERKVSGHIRLLGPNFSVRLPKAAPSTNARGPASISFLLPYGADASKYAILYGSPVGPAWLEIASAVTKTDSRAFIRGSVSSSGTYALAQIDTPRR